MGKSSFCDPNWRYILSLFNHKSSLHVVTGTVYQNFCNPQNLRKLMCHPILVTILKMCPHDSQSKGLFLESLDNVSGPKTCFTCMFAMFAFKIKVSKILKMIKWNYQLTKQNLTGLWARNCNTSQQALISKFAFRPEKLLGLLKNRPQLWKCNPIQLHIPINQLVGKTVYSCAPPPTPWGWYWVKFLSRPTCKDPWSDESTTHTLFPIAISFFFFFKL